MKSSQFSRITDELLSAYLDDDLSHQERELVDAAIAADDQVAWRLESLRQTVQLLSNLPDVAPTRSFLLDESMVGDITKARRQAAARRKTQTSALTSGQASAISATASTISHPVASHPATPDEETNSFGDRFRRGWRAFWQNGNPLLRNLATISLVLTIFVAGADTLLLQPATPASPRAVLMQQEPQAASAPAASEMAAEMTSDTDTAAADTAAADTTGPANEDSAVALRAANTEESVEDSAATEEDVTGEQNDGGENNGEQPAMAAMAAPPLATPELVDGATGDAAVGTPSAELAPVDGDVTADVTAEEVPIEEGGFGDADVAAPLILQGEATGLGSGGGAGSGGMGGGSDAPPTGGGGGGGSGGDGTEGSTVFVPLTPSPSEAFATGMLTESATAESESTDESTDESAPETMAEARMAPAPEEDTEVEAATEDTATEDDAEEIVTAEEAMQDEAAENVIENDAENTEAGIAESSQPAEPAAQERVAILAPSADVSAVTQSVITESAITEPAITEAESTEAEESISEDTQPVPDQPVPAAPTTLQTGPVQAGQPLPTAQLTRIFTWLQWGLVLVAATFGLLWWRSRNE